MEASTELIQPVVALVIWSAVMWVWMYATRIPAIFAMKLEMDSDAPSGVQMSRLPPKVRWKADNYNHLMEQPTVFYALVLSLVLLGANSELSIYAAWTYVGLRVVHSLLQALVNKIELRFAIFFLSNVPLAVLTFNAATAAFS